MNFDIPEYCHIRWQAALAVLEDLQEDVGAPFNMKRWADAETLWEKTNGCGTAACFAGYISVSPYCKALQYPENDNGYVAEKWLLGGWSIGSSIVERELFAPAIGKGSRAKTLAYLERNLKELFKDSTGKNLVAPMTFYI